MSREVRNLVGKSHVSRHSMQSCIRTYYRLRKREALIALGSHQGRGGGAGKILSLVHGSIMSPTPMSAAGSRHAIGRHEDLLRRKPKWYGHVSRSSGLANTILQGTVKGARRRGMEAKGSGGKTTSESGQDWTFQSHNCEIIGGTLPTLRVNGRVHLP